MRLTHLRLRYRGAGPAGPELSATWLTALVAPLAPPEWRPPSDVTETAEAWTVRAELGGLDDDDFEVQLYEDSLVVQGERRWRGCPPDVRVHAAELRYGPFRLALDLPASVDRLAAHATYDRGILAVVLPKRPRPAV
jgi:HSP20 family protein